MKSPQIVVYETDGWLAGQVRRLATDNGWLVRESRRPDACLRLLAEERPAVLLLKLDRDPHDGLALLAAIAERAPDCPVVLVSDAKLEGSDQRGQLSALAFDLGARYFLFPPLQGPVIEDLAAGLLTAAIRRVVGPSAGNDDA